MTDLKTISGSLIIWISKALSGLNISEKWALLISIVLILLLISATSFLAYRVWRLYLNNLLTSLVARLNPTLADILKDSGAINLLSYLAPALVCYSLIELVQIDELRFTVSLIALLRKAIYIVIVVLTTYATKSILHAGERFYETFNVAKKRPIKVYLQMAYGTLLTIAFVFIVSKILDISPWGFFTGLGAATALFALVFKDTILGFVASIQITAYDMIRIGDLITIPALNAEGQVKEISLTIVKMKNFDNTQTTIPTQAFFTHSVQNWRLMHESGSRRIKRALQIDIHSIKFCTKEMLARLAKSKLGLPPEDLILDEARGQRPTNLGLFRSYVYLYLKSRQDILGRGYDLVVRALPPSEIGLPVEIYAFCDKTAFAQFEAAQAEIFDHMIACLSEFELSAYQR